MSPPVLAMAISFRMVLPIQLSKYCADTGTSLLRWTTFRRHFKNVAKRRDTEPPYSCNRQSARVTYGAAFTSNWHIVCSHLLSHTEASRFFCRRCHSRFGRFLSEGLDKCRRGT